MHLVVFDIDGTLVDSGEYDSDLYAQAIKDVLGVQVDDQRRQ
jgi:beta-phosphoglucomutase-like phosphatase (HAD superfamily)